MLANENIYSNSNSDDSENDDAVLGLDSATSEFKGYLSKWTNYIHGWQPRFIILKDGTLSYYKSEMDQVLGMRGAISLQKASIKSHEFDECRFDVSINQNVWYLRAETPEDKRIWVEVLQTYKTDYNTHETTSLKRHGSTLSLQSIASINSIKRVSRNLREKVNEIETYRDILFKQIDILQRFFEAKKFNDVIIDVESKDGETVDFKGEAITFRETASAILDALQVCLDIISQKEECQKKKLEKEVEKRNKTEEMYRQCKEELAKARLSSVLGPDLEEGPHSTIPEDEFFDAVETGLDKIEEDRELRVRLKLQSQQSQIDDSTIVESKPNEIADKNEDFGTGKFALSHRLWTEIDSTCKEQIHHARQGVSEYGWQLFADEGEMKMYRREEEVNGMVVDPLKSCHVVKGVTAREMCHYFFDPQYRNDWETTLENVEILEKIAPDTLVFLQTHKRIWPASQRDALFWSHMRRLNDQKDEGLYNSWIVCNHSTEHTSYPAPNQGKCVRIYLTVILLCQTYLREGVRAESASRNDLTCKITYCSVVNPGGWAPATVLRAIYKKEYPKFLKRFTGYVIDQCNNKPISF